MKHKTWFRLLLKAIGVSMICTAIPNMLSQVSNAIFSYYQYVASPPGSGWLYEWNWWIPQLLWGGGQLAIGCYLFFRGEWIVNRAIPSNRPYCPDCGYDLSKNSTNQCPECGVSLPQESGALR